MTSLDLGGSVDAVARRVLGWRLVSTVGGVTVEVMLTEVEAYGGDQDPASHAFRGRTKRNGSMFGPPGTLYVYRSHGIHWCANLVTGTVGDPQAVLLRGAEIESGRSQVEARRGRQSYLTDGPGKLAQALGISGDLDAHLMTNPPLILCAGELPDDYEVEATPRIGISKAVDRRWRFTAGTG
ncbi:MAG TPA: DNA-3-methyladenine glycosylase [Actinobacteria bacterium]|nr:DNA-3-methyladenine glycosylase [Actinomycetota bacterium]